MQVVSPTTAAQFSHLLRRQMKRNFRKPLIVFTPKSQLRSAMSASPIDAFVKGSFQRVIGDGTVDPAKARRLIFACGKMANELIERRNRLKVDIAIARVEQIAPFPEDLVAAEIARYPSAEVVWVQEEPRNQGAYPFVRSMFLDRLGRDLPFIGRGNAPSPAVGSAKMHMQQQERIWAEAVPAPGAPPATTGTTSAANTADSKEHAAPRGAGKDGGKKPGREATAGKT